MKPNTEARIGIEQMLPISWPSPNITSVHREPPKQTRNHTVPAERGLSPRLLAELQKEVIEIEVERGTSTESISQKSLLLTEEVFEVMKVLRADSGIATSSRPAVELGDELADVLFVCAAIANRVPTDLSLVWVDVRGNRRQGAASRVSSRAAVLSDAIQLARQVLELITAVPQGADVAATPSFPEEITGNLLGVLLSVDVIATNKRIDLSSALDGKLQKDQLRLWR
jgi:NTP pyrophosphatase (non-canonical NTP hydrolase)